VGSRRLLAAVEAVQLIDEQDGAPPRVFQFFAGFFEELAHLFRPEAVALLRVWRDEVGEGGLAVRAPVEMSEPRRRPTAPAQQLARPEEVLLADESSRSRGRIRAPRLGLAQLASRPAEQSAFLAVASSVVPRGGRATHRTTGADGRRPETASPAEEGEEALDLFGAHRVGMTKPPAFCGTSTCSTQWT